MRRPALLVALALACNSSGTSAQPSLSDGLPASCNPLRVPGACMMPWPDAIYEQPDASTATGLRVALPQEALPVVATTGKPLDVSRWNAADGFSPNGSMLYWFAERIDPASLVPQTNIAASLAPGAATVLVDMESKQLVAHFSEVDENAPRDIDRQAIIVTPAQRLLPKHPYAVAITKGARTIDGTTPTPPPLFDAIAGGGAPNDAMSQARAARMPDVLAALGAAGVARSDLLVAWDFVTGSDEQLTGHVLSMRDQALALSGDSGIGYAITSVDENLDAKTRRRIRGTFTVPRFLDNVDETKPEAQLVFDDARTPKVLGTYEAPFTVIVPAAAATKAPLPVILYGHGLLGTGESELGGAEGSYVQDFADLEGYVVVATDWIGLSAHEDPVKHGSNGALAEALIDVSHMPWVTDRLQQALVNAMVLARTMRGRIVNDPAMTVTGKAGGAPVADASRLFYYGISLGGIMGLSFMGYDPDVARGVLGVGAGFWSTMFMRSYNWLEASVVMPSSYPDKLDVQLLLSLAQMQFDFSDPATIAPHVVAAPLEGTPKKEVLMQMGVADAQVPNVATEMIARTTGVPLLAPNAIDVYGMPPAQGPVDSALTVWDVHGSPAPPDTNRTPSSDNQVHEAIRRLPQAEQQIQTFFSTGHVVDTCGGPCRF